MTMVCLEIAHYQDVYAFWQSVPELGLSSADLQPNLERFLRRNSGGSFVIWDGPKVVGTILAGHDGKRGFLYHLLVDKAYRRQGWGRQLVEKALTWLGQEGIEKCHILVFQQNKAGLAFWRGCGFVDRVDVQLLSKSSLLREVD